MQVKKWNEADFSVERNIEVMFEYEGSKEIKITLAKGGKLEDHKAPKQIGVQVLSGKIKFGVGGEYFEMGTMDSIFLAQGVVHSLEGLENSIVRLSLYA